jgi:hypothetical protein
MFGLIKRREARIQAMISKAVFEKTQQQDKHLMQMAEKIADYYKVLSDTNAANSEYFQLLGLVISLRGEMMYDVLEKAANPDISVEQMKKNRTFLYDNEAKKLKGALTELWKEKSPEYIDKVLNEFYSK